MTLSRIGQVLALISLLLRMCGGILKQRVRQHCPRTKEELKIAIQAEWKAITQQEINRVVWGTQKGRKWTMHDRMQAVIISTTRAK